MSNREDRAWLEDMLESLRRIDVFTAGLEYQDFQKDLKTQDAVLRNLEILGEAIKLISDPLKKQHRDIPWSTVARLRDRLIHHYFGVNLDVVWDIIRRDVAPLKQQITDVLSSLD